MCPAWKTDSISIWNKTSMQNLIWVWHLMIDLNLPLHPPAWLFLGCVWCAQGFRGQIYHIPLKALDFHKEFKHYPRKSVPVVLSWNPSVFPLPLKTKHTIHPHKRDIKIKQFAGKEKHFPDLVYAECNREFVSWMSCRQSPHCWKNNPWDKALPGAFPIP